MFDKQIESMEEPCFYVSAFAGLSRMTLLAGPYRTRELAELAVQPARHWAIQDSGDPNAAIYSYAVSTAYNGYSRSILGVIVP